jgi:hypothetical protein
LAFALADFYVVEGGGGLGVADPKNSNDQGDANE